MTTRLGWIALLTICLTATGTTAQKRKQQQDKKKPTWPAITAKEKATGEKWLKLLKSKKEQVKFKAVDQLVMLGPKFADRLFRSLRDSKYATANDGIVLVFNQILKPEHAPQIGLYAKHKSVFARRTVQKTLAKFGAKVSIPVFQAAQKDKDIEVRYYAALGLIKTNRDTAALDVVFNRCLEEWDDLAQELDDFLGKSRSDEFAPWFRQKVATDDTHNHVTALRLMRTLGTKAISPSLKTLLDSEDAMAKRETINTLRVIVDGAKPIPIPKLSAFKVIAMAKKWKERI